MELEEEEEEEVEEGEKPPKNSQNLFPLEFRVAYYITKTMQLKYE